MVSVVLIKVLVRLLVIVLFTGLLSLGIWHISNFLRLPSKRRTTANALIVSSIVGGFLLITGLVLLIVPSLGSNTVLKSVLVIANLAILTSMTKLFYQCSWKKSFQALGMVVLGSLVLGVLVGMLLGIIEQII